MEIDNPTESQKLFREFLEKCSGDLEIPARSKVIDAICELSAKMYNLGWNDAFRKVREVFNESK